MPVVTDTTCYIPDTSAFCLESSLES